MNHETDPTILEDLKQAAQKSGLALRRLIDKVPFIDQGVLPFVFLLVLLPAAYYQTTALWGAVSSDVAIYTGKPVRATVMDAGVTGSRGSADVDLNLHAGYRYSFDNRAFESTNSTSSFRLRLSRAHRLGPRSPQGQSNRRARQSAQPGDVRHRSPPHVCAGFW